MKAFILEQKITVMVNQYRVFTADAVENKQEEVAFAQQKRLALKEKFDFFTDETKQHVLFSVQARKVLDLGTRYDVLDADGKAIGILGKLFKASLLRSTWNVFKPGDEAIPQVIAQERSKGLALFRRIWQLLPFLGDFPFFLKYHFDFRRPNEEKVVIEYNKTTTFRDHYLLRIQDEIENEIDWRVLIALGVLMDALQSR
jgi:hypothetical protein